VKQAHSDKARQQANEACQNNEPPVVLTREASTHTKHRGADNCQISAMNSDRRFIWCYFGNSKLNRRAGAGAHAPVGRRPKNKENAVETRP
jgi:hypothetical protein